MTAAQVVRWDRGTLLLEGCPGGSVPDYFRWDPRVGLPRAQAMMYHRLILDFHRGKVPYRDQARAYQALDRPYTSSRMARPYQSEALRAWREAGRRGSIVLPTGAGKSFVAELCMRDANRATLVIAPTLDLVGQWYDALIRAFGEPVGLLGGGHHEVHPITVSTYDSAWMHMELYGNRFGLVIFDEVHHLPGASYAQAAQCSIAPFRLGLTATMERPDGGHHQVAALIGPVVYQKEITELSGEFLANYRTEVRQVHLSAKDRNAYEAARQTYRAFITSQGIKMGGPGGWHQFLRKAAQSAKGREALRAWRESRRILHGAEAKLQLTAELLRQHAPSRTILFTNDNKTVYDISRKLLVPAITHQTDLKERRAILQGFGEGTLPVIATSRVLNEGVDLPSAEVAIVLSGTSTKREHVQRLGRILRPQQGKQAVLYELVVANSIEERHSEKRRDHLAYRQG